MGNSLDVNGILSRVALCRAKEQEKVSPIGNEIFTAALCLLGILGAVAVEFYTLTIALHAQFQALSDGTDLGSDLLPLRYGVAAALIFSHVLLHGQKSSGVSWRGVLGKFHLIPVIVVIGGLAIFMFMATSQATGSDNGKITPIGIALGVVCSALFSISFLACNRIVGIFLPTIQTILSGIAQRRKVAGIDRRLKALEDCQANIKALQLSISEREAPDALRRLAAMDAAAAVGKVASEAHDRYVSRLALEGVDIGENDSFDGVSPDTPLQALKDRADYLKSLDFAHFFNLLKKDSQHA